MTSVELKIEQYRKWVITEIIELKEVNNQKATKTTLGFCKGLLVALASFEELFPEPEEYPEDIQGIESWHEAEYHFIEEDNRIPGTGC